MDNLNALKEELSSVFRQRETGEWVDLLGREHELPVAPVNSVSDALDNEQVRARNMTTEMDHPAMGTIPVIEHPLNFENATSGFHSPPPRLSEDTRDVLTELGYDDEAIEQFADSGAIPDYEE